MRDNKGQAVAMDLILVCICVSIFAIGIWAVSNGGQAPVSESLRSRQDYVKSMLLTTLFSTPDPKDLRYAGKSISDLLCMYLSNPDKMPMDVVIAKMKEAKIGEALKEKAVGSDAEWIIYADSDAASGTQGKRVICLHGKSGSDTVEECPPGTKVIATESTAATAEVVFPSGKEKRFVKMPIFMTVKWS